MCLFQFTKHFVVKRDAIFSTWFHFSPKSYFGSKFPGLFSRVAKIRLMLYNTHEMPAKKKRNQANFREFVDLK